MRFVLQNMAEFKLEHQELIKKAVEMSQNVLNWPKWQDSVRNVHSFNETRMNGTQVLDLMAKADAILDLKEFHSLSNTIAYTYLFAKVINLNDYFLDQFLKMDPIVGLSKVSGSLVHELQHEEGFTHRWWVFHNGSVPYRMQHLFEDAFVEYYSAGSIGKSSGLVPERGEGIVIKMDVEFRRKLSA